LVSSDTFERSSPLLISAAMTTPDHWSHAERNMSRNLRTSVAIDDPYQHIPSIAPIRSGTSPMQWNKASELIEREEKHEGA
jgi:hypothetical protein